MGKKLIAKKTASPPTFVSIYARKKFEEYTAKRSIYHERGFQFTEEPSLGHPELVSSMVLRNQWKTFCSHPKLVVIPLVREFCANFPENEKKPIEVSVRGVKVIIHLDAINNYLETPNVEDEGSQIMLEADSDYWQRVIEQVCVEGTSWTSSSQGIVSFPRNKLGPDAKVWYHFLKANLLPSSHIQSVSKFRASMLYCILVGKRINMGQLIYNELHDNAPKKTGHIWFAALITGLCIASDVEYFDQEEQLKLSGAITPLTVNRICKEQEEL